MVIPEDFVRLLAGVAVEQGVVLLVHRGLLLSILGTPQQRLHSGRTVHDKLVSFEQEIPVFGYPIYP